MNDDVSEQRTLICKMLRKITCKHSLHIAAYIHINTHFISLFIIREAYFIYLNVFVYFKQNRQNEYVCAHEC